MLPFSYIGCQLKLFNPYQGEEMDSYIWQEYLCKSENIKLDRVSKSVLNSIRVFPILYIPRHRFRPLYLSFKLEISISYSIYQFQNRNPGLVFKTPVWISRCQFWTRDIGFPNSTYRFWTQDTGFELETPIFELQDKHVKLYIAVSNTLHQFRSEDTSFKFNEPTSRDRYIGHELVNQVRYTIFKV